MLITGSFALEQQGMHMIGQFKILVPIVAAWVFGHQLVIGVNTQQIGHEFEG